MVFWFQRTTAQSNESPQTYQNDPYTPIPFYESEYIPTQWGFRQNFVLSDAIIDAETYENSAKCHERVCDLLMTRSQSPYPFKEIASAPYVGFQIDSKGMFKAIRDAISHTPSNQQSDLLRRQSKLATLYEKQLIFSGKIENFSNAIGLAEAVVAKTPEDDPARPLRLECLSNLLQHRFERTGNPSDINDSVDYITAAMDLIIKEPSAHDNDVKARIFRNSALKLELRSRWNGSLTDLDRAIDHSERALHLLNSKARDRLVYMCESGSIRASRFQRTRKDEDLNLGIGIMERAIAAIDKNNRHTPALLDSLASRYLERYEHKNALEDLELAVRKSEDACNAQLNISIRHPDLGKYVSGLARKSSIYAERSGKLTKFARMHNISYLGIKTLQDGHPNRAEFLECLGDVNVYRFYFLTSGENLENFAPGNREWVGPGFLQFLDRSTLRREKAVEMYTEAANLKNGHSFTRIRACKKLADMDMTISDWGHAAERYRKAIGLWPRLNPLNLTRDDMEYVISKLVGLGSLVAFCDVKAGRTPAEALQGLESGRGIISGLTIGEFYLKKADENIYNRYIELRHALSSSLTGVAKPSEKASIADAILRRRQEVDELEKLESQIRSIPRFSRFPESNQDIDIRELAKSGPIIAFNTTPRASHAFIVTKDKLFPPLLLNLNYDELRRNVEILVRGQPIDDKLGPLLKDRMNTKPGRTKKLCEILDWLWESAVKPVLEQLELIQSNKQATLPRIWWVTSGLLGLLPLHAAGSGWGKTIDNTASHVVSSYVPTLKSLEYARSMQHRLNTLAGKLMSKAPVKLNDELLLVTMPKTEGMSDLKVDNEIKGISKTFTSTASPPLATPSMRTVLERLKTTAIAHFVCHGISEALNPSRGGIMLQDGRLTIQQLSSISLSNAQIAYLSACSTAENKTKHLVDESIHLAGAFNLVGFPHVIGTLWPASNSIASKVAPMFYERFHARVKDGQDPNDAVAYALHDSVLSLWKNDPSNTVITWAPFIHVGA